MYKILLVIFLGLLAARTTCETHFEGYYWRDFAGEIPFDALEGGSDRDGNPIYIGQILHENKLITAKIYKNDNKGYYPLLYKEYTGTENLKILCVSDPKRFVWIQTEANKIHLLTNTHLIRGGYEPGHIMYIGRVFYNFETSVGKVSTGTNENLGLYIGTDGKEINFKSFEILSYQPNLETYPIDPRFSNNTIKPN